MTVATMATETEFYREKPYYDPMIHEIMMRSDLSYFAEEILNMEISEHHENWSVLIAKHKKLCIEAPRDHGKSYMFSFAYAIWRAYYNWIPPTMMGSDFKSVPRVSVGYIFSNTQDQAIKLLEIVKREIESNPALMHLVPALKDIWSKTEIKLSNGAIIRARGWGQSVRGAHPCLIYETRIVTDRGVEAIGSLVGQKRKILTGLGTWKDAVFWSSGVKEVVTSRYGNKYTRDKLEVTLTPNHKVLAESGWHETRDLRRGQRMEIATSNHSRLFELMGWMWNDGKFHNGQHFIMFNKRDSEALKRLQRFFTDNPDVGDGCSWRVSKQKIQNALDTIGNGYRKKRIEKGVPVLTTPEQELAWLRGMFSANGCVVRSVRIKLARKELIEFIESLLHKYGIETTPIVHHTDRQGFSSYTIHIHKKSLLQFLSLIGFIQSYKTAKAQELAFGFYENVLESEKREVFDFKVLEPSCEREMSAIADGIIVHNCWVVCDDVLNDETIFSEVTRMRQIDYFFSAVTPMLIPGGQLLVVGTPFHQEDLYERLRDNKAYFFYRSPAINDMGEALWRTRYTKLMLMQRKEEVGSTRFAREYLCVDKDTLIRTIDGYKKIRTILPGEEVLSHDGKYHRVLDVFRNRLDDRKVFKVKTSNGLGHIVTEGHELYVTTTDYRRDIEVSKTEWKRVEEISERPGDRTYLKVPLIPPPILGSSFNEDMSYLAGWYLAEGHCGATQQVTLSLGAKDPIDRIQDAAERVFGKKFVDYTHAPGCVQWSINSKDAKFLFSQFGKGASNKRIPEIFRGASESAKRALLSAYFLGDGHFDGMTLECASVSFQLICDISDLLGSIGVACQIQKHTDAGPSEIMGRSVQVKDAWRLKISGSNLDKFYDLPRVRRNSSSFVKDGFLYSRIRSIEEIKYEETHVYDLHVEDAHSYVGLHGTFHNCLPISDDSSLFPEKMLEGCYDFQHEMPNHLTAEDRKELQVFTGVDLALSTTVGADYTVITTIGVDRFKNRWILDIRRKRGLSMMDQLREIEDVYKNYRPLKVLIEDNAFQKVFSDELIRNTDIPVEGFTTTGHNKNALDKGVPSLQILFENRKFIIPRKTERDREKTNVLVNELKCFTWQDGKLQGLGAHDDTVMSLWIANEACNSYQFSFSFVGDS
jgi:intein/homing endonuclease